MDCQSRAECARDITAFHENKAYLAADELRGEEAIIIKKEQLAKFARAQQLKASGQTIPKELLKKRSKLQRQFKYIYI